MKDFTGSTYKEWIDYYWDYSYGEFVKALIARDERIALEYSARRDLQEE